MSIAARVGRLDPRRCVKKEASGGCHAFDDVFRELAPERFDLLMPKSGRGLVGKCKVRRRFYWRDGERQVFVCSGVLSVGPRDRVCGGDHIPPKTGEPTIFAFVCNSSRCGLHNDGSCISRRIETERGPPANTRPTAVRRVPTSIVPNVPGCAVVSESNQRRLVGCETGLSVAVRGTPM